MRQSGGGGNGISTDLIYAAAVTSERPRKTFGTLKRKDAAAAFQRRRCPLEHRPPGAAGVIKTATP